MSGTLGRGEDGPDNATITVQPGAIVRGGNFNAISLRDGAAITIGDGAMVSNNATTTNGLWGAGGDTIEFRSGGTLTIGEGAAVTSLGSSNRAEAVNLMGEGNTVINRGTISAINTAAIWFEDREIGAINTIDNYGVIRRGSGSETVIENVIGNQQNGAVHFINRTGAIVYGSLSFANGDDILELYPHTEITGGFNGGGGTNTLTLNGEAGSSDTLAGNISNFQTLTKTGLGTWTLEGSIGSNSGVVPLAVDVQQGTLALTGNNTNFNGTVTVDPAGTLEARAQSLPPEVTNNGLMRFVQPDNGTYTGAIIGSGAVAKTGAGVLTLTGANSYSGGTTIQGGTVSIAADSALGAASGDITLDGGTLRLTSSFDLSADRAIAITANDGTIETSAGVTSTISQAITGAGELTKAGGGTLILSADNTYSGGTTIGVGTLQLGDGGTSGSILGDVTNNGTLAFDRSDTYTFGGLISGTGSVTHTGSGTTILTADNTYSGDTTISSGWLYIDGNQTGATGLTTAQSGTRLGGSGIIGGDVVITNGATLSPGAVPLTPATLTINGNLTLNETSTTFFNLVTPGAGGPLNDLVNVGGDLALDGTLNLFDAGSDLTVGVYRIFNYGGSLDDNGMVLGDFLDENLDPTGRPMDDFYVQTSIPGQVNLVNTAGLELTYWDGGNGAQHNNSVINGGDGTWRIAGAVEPVTDNWTDDIGAVNAPWDNGSFAIFTGAAGTVTIDNGNGQVTASGMQFITDGYEIDGDPLTLIAATGTSVIRVGGPGDPDVTATISADLQGSTILQKTGGGTLVLEGANSYTGGTIVDGGTLEISADTNLGAAGTGLAINGATLHTTADLTSARATSLGAAGGTIETDTGTTFTLNGVVSGTGGLTKTGDGSLVLAQNNTYSGGTTISAGTLQLGDGGTTGSILGDVTNNGTLAFNRSDSYTFAGTVSGTGSLEQIGSGTTILTADNTYSGGTTIGVGTLQLGDGGTSGSILGDVTNNGTLAFDRSDTYTFGGLISGTGSVTHTGSGTTILTADNTYSGDTTISAGTLQLGDGGTSGSIVGNVTNNGTLAFDRSDTYTFGGTVSGTGSLEQIGSGTTILTADSTYSGGTTISAGTLQLGNGDTTGSIVGDVTNNGVLAIDRTNTLTLDGQILGSGALVQQGPGTTILTANNTYSGGTTISDGTLQLGNGADSGAIVGDVVNDGTLIFNRTGLLPMPGVISGSGNLMQQGDGTTVLLGDNTYSGPTHVVAGALYVNGNQTSAQGLTSVADGATLGGLGIIGGNVEIGDGATLSPGDVGVAPGTLTINGDLALGSGSLLDYSFGQTNVVGGALNDLTVVQGDLVLDGTLNVTTSPGGSFDPGVYRVISYAGGFTDNGLIIGEIPSPDFLLQTSVAQQVNLINTAGLTLNYWDGADTSLHDNGVINGGDGLWQNSAGNDNWTTELGNFNAPFTDEAPSSWPRPVPLPSTTVSGT
ncbi:autotransporter-associated beta strand repeat-containing protein [Pelagibacterium sp. H642]|uniref:autotransporter-associated beta strand repeat-containing protein n=1 Tax=Pelagibacterium sp. H642 TaxID=1881069 RepID=UPI0028163CB0|nr:autotransporter-associated beta strand repeat-containing protein [Pelagibacterium sp. H642]WMT91979.1 autotransporter-associated beta strand repeat-containing protein [Pelagibacterium sp. H642]